MKSNLYSVVNTWVSVAISVGREWEEKSHESKWTSNIIYFRNAIVFEMDDVDSFSMRQFYWCWQLTGIVNVHNSKHINEMTDIHGKFPLVVIKVNWSLMKCWLRYRTNLQGEILRINQWYFCRVRSVKSSLCFKQTWNDIKTKSLPNKNSLRKWLHLKNDTKKGSCIQFKWRESFKLPKNSEWSAITKKWMMWNSIFFLLYLTFACES